jgi:CheY-like chemotaxis protein
MERASFFSILVVDDELDAREGMSLVLEMQGYIVIQVANEQEALDTLQNTEPLPSLVVLDLTMPVLDGWSFLRRRSQDQTLADVPVVIVSSNRPDDEVLSGVEEFLQKPVEITRLLGIIGRIETRAR